DEEKPLHALLHGRGVCLNEKSYREQAKIVPTRKRHGRVLRPSVSSATYRPYGVWTIPGGQRARLLTQVLRALGSARLGLSPHRLILRPLLPAERDSREHEEPTTSEMAEETYSPKIFRPKHTRISELKAEAVKKDRRKKLSQSKFVGGAENTAHPRVISAPEMRQESEQGPCRRHMEASLQELKASPRMVPRAVYLPNCDRKGFYKRKQCKPSRGRKRGICWCVDKYGMKLPGMEYGRKYIYLSI
ncbi:hypothetical protein E2I00_013141, partial [Balaenoptera physalus]